MYKTIIFFVFIILIQGSQTFGSAEAPPLIQDESNTIQLFAARPNPYDRGNCYLWKGCRGESIGSYPVDSPNICGSLGGKSWKNSQGKCIDLLEGPYSTEPIE